MGPVFINEIATALGEPRPITGLKSREDPQAIGRIASAGHVSYLSYPGSSEKLLERLLSRFAATTRLQPSEIDAVVIDANCPGDWSPVLAEFGLATTPVHQVSGAFCTDSIIGIKLAHGLITSGFARRILCVSINKTPEEARIIRAGTAIASDGASCCIVSAEPGGYRVLDIRQQTTWHPESATRAGQSRTLAVQASKTTADLPGRLALRGLRYRVFLTVNIGLFATFLSEFLKVEIDDIFEDHVAPIGHVLSSDYLINLNACRTKYQLQGGERLLVLGMGSASNFSLMALEAAPEAAAQSAALAVAAAGHG